MNETILEDIGTALRHFYDTLLADRAGTKACNCAELEGIRNAEIAELAHNLAEYHKDGVSCLDLLSGNCVVPLAIKYLQKEGVLPELLHEVHALDDNQRDGLVLAEKHCRSLGLEGIIPVHTNLYTDYQWQSKVPAGRIGLVTAINPDDGISVFQPMVLFMSAKSVSGNIFFAQPVNMAKGLEGYTASELESNYELLRDGKTAAKTPIQGEGIYHAYGRKKE